MLEDHHRFPHLGLFRPTALLQSAMIHLYPPALLFRLPLFSSVIARSFVAQYSASPSLEIVRNTFTNPKPRR